MLRYYLYTFHCVLNTPKYHGLEFRVNFMYLFIYFCFLGLHVRHMGVPRLGVESELQLPAYTTATARRDPSRICHLHHSSQQHWILNPLRKAMDLIGILVDTSRICFGCTTTGTPRVTSKFHLHHILLHELRQDLSPQRAMIFFCIKQRYIFLIKL